MKHLGHKLLSLLIGALSFYATSYTATPLAMWIKFGVFVIVTFVAYLIVKPKNKD